MHTALQESSRSRNVFIPASFLFTLLALLALPISASAQQNSNGKLTETDGVPRWSSQTKVNQSEGPEWTISTETIVLERIGGGTDQVLVARVPGSTPFLATNTSGVVAFNSNQFQQGFSAGPRIGLVFQGNSRYGAELSYFNILDQSATKAIGPDTPPDWLVMRAPGSFWQTQDFPYQAMAWQAGTNLYSAEANGRLGLSSRVTMLAGFRWLQLGDRLLGTLTPADATAPTWKITSGGTANLFQVTAGDEPAGNYAPFWHTRTVNRLFGGQIGVDGRLLKLGRFSVDGTIKTGVFDNHAEQSTGVSLQKVVHPTRATTSHTAFVGEARLQLKYRIKKGLSLKGSYELLGLDGVALAPGQIQETLSSRSDSVAIGINCRAGLLFQGATGGLEYTFQK